MKPNVIIYLLFSLFVLIVSWEFQHSQAVADFHQEISEEEAIRLRILANSDGIQDQMVKRSIRDKVNEQITEWVVGIDDLDEAGQLIKENLSEVESIVEEELQKLGLNQDYTVEFEEVQFPTKIYGNIVYPAGWYNAVLITLGEGNGENWWCVLFPPLCFLDFENGEAVEPELTDEVASTDTSETEEEEEPEDSEEVKISFFIFDFFGNLFDRLFG
ncbi:stage II sporulation protein R [Alkalihalobacillus alcalophilus ATCC 27647 = CGMCC 1.3604]|uniref:Stage II sporulation protein R n=1 Tax=Alkalihalobacillus alcalophilus ATCC 27647 = CGMCC 1.3604 TaxID=1218173 RepID=A0A094WM45_ALKAL|nr:stage II sporulation protein R [Alkalihalobacillus alcalophilus]KGA97038.1 stage II sporulation protein R [Alkalihalobacillus alcalophilus ATCC 27647 = CGMCC 1.3604]MED1561128.1 stage II sporulation protein R [Alkalihalobacillus alcalophilus]THG89116.1 stage II sporulation protein R [Alkalihalobacillus alcalophilus ATCC 27647 = CGMCC 1.3604]